MGVRVVFDGPRGYVSRRWFRAGVTLFGGALQMVGGLAMVPAILGLFFVPVAVVDDPGRGWKVAVLWGLLIALCPLGLMTGGYLIKGNRGLVLFLRRFRHGEAIQVVTSAVRSIGRTWRVVTLDDATIVPVGVAPGARRLTAVVTRLSAWRAWLEPRLTRLGGHYDRAEKVWKVVMQAALWGCAGLIGYVFWRDHDLELLLVYPNTPEAVAFRVLLVVLGVGAALFVVLMGLGFLLVGAGLVILPFVGAIAPFAEVPEGVRKAEGVKSATVRNREEIAEVAEALADAGRATISPRLAVLTVETAVWRHAVLSLAAVSATPLIDVSRPTRHLLWEIEELGRLYGPRCVYVGHLDRLRRFTANSGAVDVLAVPAGSVIGRLETLLDGKEVLAYTTGWRGRRRFARALFARLEALPRSPEDRHRTRRLALAQLAGVAAFAAVLAAMAGLVTGLG
ncbi:hypothetical protein [Streptomyces sp. NPDC058964]|uniref:hypothetical protein n=1 Tax=Streptomyces sp. NPDC058964 TaxID=3346681 RepID=UPI0036B66ECF